MFLDPLIRRNPNVLWRRPWRCTGQGANSRERLSCSISIRRGAERPSLFAGRAPPGTGLTDLCHDQAGRPSIQGFCEAVMKRRESTRVGCRGHGNAAWSHATGRG